MLEIIKSPLCAGFSQWGPCPTTYCKHWGPFREGSWANDWNYFCCNSKSNYRVMSQYCICHDSTDLVVRAKPGYDLVLSKVLHLQGSHRRNHKIYLGSVDCLSVALLAAAKQCWCHHRVNRFQNMAVTRNIFLSLAHLLTGILLWYFDEL